MKSSDPSSVDPTPLTCYSTVSDKSKAAAYETAISSKAGRYEFMADKKLLTYPLAMDIKSRNSSLTVPMGTWSNSDGYKKAPNYDGKPVLMGYCIEMIEELAKRMFFDYELVLPTDD